MPKRPAKLAAKRLAKAHGEARRETLSESAWRNTRRKRMVKLAAKHPAKAHD
ncbi:hypothetical protein KDC22_10790 [Paenibacillus tritici]|uniref:hypothetical protein n=1 Tax=Paenibacillus tritici TaxID=1873425 RepID=UPI001BA51DBD|nr:hypothetical protein [Paenibacillus tritici]QUL56911.1 hypothetical protein KDC22_10790 [Paenibacillus tritici]